MYERFFLWFLLLLLSESYLKAHVFCWLTNAATAVVDDIFRINRKFFSIDTIKIFTGTVPIYLLAGQADRRVHSCFYQSFSHKNINQAPQWWYTTLNTLNDVAVLLYSSFSLIAPHEDLRRTARIFGVGFLSVMAVKDILKNIHIRAAVRPFNEHFCPIKTYGGFPSGHMAQACYIATVLGYEYGPKVAILCSIGAGLMFFSLINSNRHFASQVIAGAALGIAYGIAVCKVIEFNRQLFECDVACQENHLYLRMRYSF